MLQRVFKSLEDILNLNTSFFFVRRRRSVQQAACFRIPGIKSRTSFERVRRRIRIKWVPHVKPVWKSYIRYDNATKWGVSAKEKRSCSGKPTAKAILRQILHAFIAHPPTHTFNQHNGRFTAHTAWFNTTNPQFPSHNVFICITNWLTDWLTTWRRVLLVKLSVSHLVKKFPTIYGTRRFITAFTTACQLPLS